MIKTWILFTMLSASLSYGGTVGYYTSMTNTAINWASNDLGNELVTVANEIASVVSWAPVTGRGTNEVGENAGSSINTMTNRWTMREMQDMVNQDFSKLWYGTNALEGATNTYALSALGGQGTSENQFYLTDFYIAAGMNSNGFRKAVTNYPNDWTDINDAHFTYGFIAAGDIIGPWNFDDLQRCFDEMTRSVDEAIWSDVDYPESNSVIETVGIYMDWATTVSEMNSIWGTTVGTTQNRVPAGYSQSILGTYFNLTATRAHNEARVTPLGVNIPRSIAYYARAEDFPLIASGRTPSTTFDDNGDDVVQNQWHSWSSTNHTPTSATHYAYSPLPLGSVPLSIPTLASEPATNTTDSVGWHIESAYDKSVESTEDYPVSISTYEWSYTRD